MQSAPWFFCGGMGACRPTSHGMAVCCRVGCPHPAALRRDRSVVGGGVPDAPQGSYKFSCIHPTNAAWDCAAALPVMARPGAITAVGQSLRRSFSLRPMPLPSLVQ